MEEKQMSSQLKYYYNNRERVIAKQLEVNKKRRAEQQEYIRKLKTETPCTDCGILYPYYVMDFDHIGDDKRMEVGRLAKSNYGWKALLAEIDKCELVCSNCHRIRTFSRKPETA